MATHECMIDTCARRVDDKWAVCGEHWRMLPTQLTQQLARSYVPGMTRDDATPGLYLALVAVHAWIRETFGGEDKKPHDPGRWERLVRYVRARDEARKRLREAKAADPEPEPEKPFRHLTLVP